MPTGSRRDRDHPDFRDAPQCIQQHGGRKILGKPVLRIYVLCGRLYGDRGVPEYRVLRHRLDRLFCQEAVAVNLVVIILLSLPCALGFNVLSGITPFGPGSTIMDLEDFIVSNNLLPLGSLVYLAFCTSRYGWGFKKFLG